MKGFRITLGVNGPEHVNYVLQCVAMHFSDFTLREVRGVWLGKPVDTYEIDVAGYKKKYVNEVAHALGIQFNQTHVMVTKVGTAHIIKVGEIK
jgi:uncharacterized lipoprotein YddW (UPF0748 family)